MRNLQILCFHECFLVRRNLLLIEEKNSYTVKRDKRDVLCIQERMYSIGFPFREHYFVTTSMSKLRVTEKRCKVLLQLNSIAEAYHHRESINTKMARAKKKRVWKIFVLLSSLLLAKHPFIQLFQKFPSFKLSRLQFCHGSVIKRILF